MKQKDRYYCALLQGEPGPHLTLGEIEYTIQIRRDSTAEKSNFYIEVVGSDHSDHQIPRKWFGAGDVVTDDAFRHEFGREIVNEVKLYLTDLTKEQ